MYRYYLLKVFFVTGFLVCTCSVFAQSNFPLRPAELVRFQTEYHVPFIKCSILNVSSQRIESAAQTLRRYDHVQLNQVALQKLVAQHQPAMEFSVPYNGETLTLELVAINPFTSDFKVLTNSSGESAVDYKPGIYYRGILKGDDHSVAAFSFFDDQMSGIVSSSMYGNVVIGKLQGDLENKTDYVIYNDGDFISPHHTQCNTIDNPAFAAQLVKNINIGASLRTNKCVRLYYEVDHDIYVQSGSDLTATVNWMTAVNNEVAAIFSSDNLNSLISEIYVWTDADPYNGATASAQLSLFKQQRPQFAGDLAQLVSIEPEDIGGVASNIDGFCSTDDKYCYSEVDYEYNQVPTYSWTVDVLAHEFGHLMGSFHTHNCSWPGGAIDDCGPLAGFPNEGSCDLGPDPTNGGTIMSYCHLTNFGINFSNGFGDLPCNAISGAIDQSVCLTSDCAPIIPDYCPSNGNTTSEWIQTSKFNNHINNSGAGGGYSDFIDQVINMPAGSTVNFTLTPGYNYTHWTEYFSVWIDFNNDKDFFDKGENVFQSSGTNVSISGSFVIPGNLTGQTRMRVSMKFDTLAAPCEVFKYGEVEDYTVDLSPVVNYCSSMGNDATQEWIDYIQIGALTRESASDGGYFDGTSMSADGLEGADNYITYSAGMSGGSHEEHWKLWIDYNHDGDFEDDGEKVFGRKSSSKKYLVRKFTIPSTAVLGATRMRLSMERDVSPGACDNFQYGEVEDYTLNIVSQLPSARKAELAAEIFPNPTNDWLSIHVTSSASSATVQIISLDGRLLQTQTSDIDDDLRMNVSQLLSGMYFVRITSADGMTVVKKFLRQ